MRTVLSRTIRAASLLVFVATMALWVRTYRATDYVTWRGNPAPAGSQFAGIRPDYYFGTAPGALHYSKTRFSFR